MRRGGFTLIELMIVIGLIAVVAAIAIPSLLQMKITSNEGACAAAMRTYVGAQATFHRTDRDGDGVKEFAADLDQLYHVGGTDWKLIDRSFAEADDDADMEAGAGLRHNIAKAGYLFHDLDGESDGTAYEADAGGNGWLDGYGLWGYPEAYNHTGRQSFVVNIRGVVYVKDISDVTSDADWTASDFPDISDWLTVSD